MIAALAVALAVLLTGPRRPPRSPARRRRHWGVNPAAVAAAAAAGVGCVAAVPITWALTAAVLAATAGLRWRRHRRARRRLDEARALEAALDILVAELRAGAHPVRALTAAAGEAGQPQVAAGLRAVAARARLGGDVPAGLRDLARSAALTEPWERLAVCWQLAADHGLSISTLMRTAQRDLVERQQFWGRVSAGLAGARATAAILAGLPVLGVVLGQLIGAAPVAFLLGAGGWLLVAGAVLACGGLLWCDRIADRLVR